MRRFLDAIAKALLKPLNTVVTLLLGIYTVAWGAWVINPFWNVFTSSTVYTQLLGVMPSEYFWGGIAIVAGILTLLGAIKHMPKTMITGCFVAGLYWFVISILYFLGDWHNTGGVTALFIATLAMYNYLNSKINNKHKRLFEMLDED